MFNRFASKFQLGTKFNLLLTLVFLIGILISGTALSAILQRGAETEVTSKALILIQTMNSVRGYTDKEVTPKLIPLLQTELEFQPQILPAYSARQVFENFRKNKDYADFFYKEATLNPTNLRDKADTFETDLIERFRNDSQTKELTGFRSFQGGDLFYIARPMSVNGESCLLCHSTPEAAPKSMLATYGRENGFGWKLHEIIGAQIISVPASEIVATARQSFLLVMLTVLGIFVFAVILINLLLRFSVIDPLNRMSKVAHDVSTGRLDAEFTQTSHDEIGVLASAFNRMKLSLSMAMDMLEKP